tara:strand:+ start:5330 stop:5761 length:432 start_codon:yes stop_codon:yes gene_type:complete
MKSLVLASLLTFSSSLFAGIEGDWVGTGSGSIGFLKTCKGEANVSVELKNSELLIGYGLDCGEEGDLYNETENLVIHGNRLLHSGKVVGEINSSGFKYKLKFDDEDYTETGRGKINKDGSFQISLKGYVGIVRLFKYKAKLSR